MNDEEKQEDVLTNVADFIVERGNHKNLTVLLHEKVTIQNEFKQLSKMKKLREAEERWKNRPASPKEQVRILMKQLVFRAAEYAESKKLDINERLALQDYVDKKLRAF